MVRRDLTDRLVLVLMQRFFERIDEARFPDPRFARHEHRLARLLSASSQRSSSMPISLVRPTNFDSALGCAASKRLSTSRSPRTAKRAIRELKPFNSCEPRLSISKDWPASWRVLSATTIWPGAAAPCKRAARLASVSCDRGAFVRAATGNVADDHVPRRDADTRPQSLAVR